MRKYTIEEYDIMFEDFDGIGELIEAVCEIENERRSKLIVALTNHIRIMLKEKNVLAISIGTIPSTGDRFVRISVFDVEPDGKAHSTLRDEDNKIYIEMED